MLATQVALSRGHAQIGLGGEVGQVSGVAGEVGPAIRCFEKRKTGEARQVHALGEHQIGFHACVGQERLCALVGKGAWHLRSLKGGGSACDPSTKLSVCVVVDLQTEGCVRGAPLRITENVLLGRAQTRLNQEARGGHWLSRDLGRFEPTLNPADHLVF